MAASNKQLAILLVCLLAAGCQAEIQDATTARPAKPPASSQALNPASPHRDTLNAGLDYLLNCQSENGLWHSSTYGNLRGGAAITCLVLYAMGHCDESTKLRVKAQCQKALDQLMPVLAERHYVANADGPDYTNYATAMLLTATAQLQLDLPLEHRQQMIDYLVRAQIDEDEGFAADAADYGGWDLTGWMTGQRPTRGTNISVSSTVLETLADHGQNPDVGRALAKARRWVARCQNVAGDGGFYFHPRRDHDGNKAGWYQGNLLNPRSYGTATADGLRSLKYTGYDPQAESVAQARRWYQDHLELNRVPGFEHESGPDSWAEGLRYYYYFTLAKTLDQHEPASARHFAEGITRRLAMDQRPNGCWQNSNARMREDDPLIATSFAIIALAESSSWLDQPD